MEKRSKNFTQKEKDFLLDLVMSQKDIVENKKTDATSIQEENMCWENITNVYAFLKRKARKNLYNDKAEVMKTGGGPYTPKCDAQDLKISAQLQSQFYPDSNPYDSSAQLFDKPPRENSSPQTSCSYTLDIAPRENSSPQTSCSYTLDNIDHNYTEKYENATISQRVELPGRVPKKRRKATPAAPRQRYLQDIANTITERKVTKTAPRQRYLQDIANTITERKVTKTKQEEELLKKSIFYLTKKLK
ncbi:Myb/SANT-like DNA-binding domain [Popillia japonica]|uniref:Regulatory protein zeste n=1 Tax=Popillia japonica TaxID=7064 RepID=A0AAW1MBC2_POPJA